MTNTDALTGKLLDVINQVQGAVSAHSADAVSLVLTSTRVDGICGLASMFALLVIFIIVSYKATMYVKKAKKDKDKDKDNYDEGSIGFAILGGMGTFILAVISFLFLIYPWTWIQVFDPKLYLAHEIIGKVLQ